MPEIVLSFVVFVCFVLFALAWSSRGMFAWFAEGFAFFPLLRCPATSISILCTPYFSR